MSLSVMGNGEKNEEVATEGIGVKEEKKLGKNVCDSTEIQEEVCGRTLTLKE